MSSPTTSAPTSAVEAGSLMSRASDAASEFGRRLTIDERDRREGMARTRGMAKREDERQAVSRAATRSGGKSTRQAANATASSSKAPARGSQRKPQAQESSEDEESEDSDEDEAADGPPSDSEHDPRPGAAGPGEKVLQILSAFEPNHYTYDEMRQQSLPGRTEPSISYGALSRTIATLLNSDRACAALERQVPIEGPIWSSQAVNNMTARAYKIFNNLHKYERQPREGADVIDTVAEIRRFFSAVEGILRRFRNMPADSHQRLVSLLRYVIAQVIQFDRDVRGPSSSGRPVFAGGSDQHEHNLYLRFTSSHADWMWCLETLRRVGSLYAQCFRVDAQSWAQIMQTLRAKHSNDQWPNATVKNFVLHLRDRLNGMQVPLE
ncbi:Hypothetical predicted protein [Lecanosticta acicola]|uniref:Uncharacterized protein n=1 Tax=Lecanosticta acicola TaxID=111012 RepID=A0AAI8YZ12_9PEZI|nr:Hypothetical predicted protein [Lecanosticta acicola]